MAQKSSIKQSGEHKDVDASAENKIIFTVGNCMEHIHFVMCHAYNLSKRIFNLMLFVNCTTKDRKLKGFLKNFYGQIMRAVFILYFRCVIVLMMCTALACFPTIQSGINLKL